MLKLPIKLRFPRSAFNKLYQGIIKLIPLFIEGTMPGKTERHEYGVPDHPVLYLCQLEWNDLVMDTMDDQVGTPMDSRSEKSTSSIHVLAMAAVAQPAACKPIWKNQSEKACEVCWKKKSLPKSRSI